MTSVSVTALANRSLDGSTLSQRLVVILGAVGDRGAAFLAWGDPAHSQELPVEPGLERRPSTGMAAKACLSKDMPNPEVGTARSVV